MLLSILYLLLTIAIAILGFFALEYFLGDPWISRYPWSTRNPAGDSWSTRNPASDPFDDPDFDAEESDW